MINSVEQYRYVTGANVDDKHPHGDLDRIIIDGKIMPNRTGDDKNILRGEDVAYLMEMHARLRNDLSGLTLHGTARGWFDRSGGVVTAGITCRDLAFTRQLSNAQLSNIHKLTRQLIDKVLPIKGLENGKDEFDEAMTLYFAKKNVCERTVFLPWGDYPLGDYHVLERDMTTPASLDGTMLRAEIISSMLTDMELPNYVVIRPKYAPHEPDSNIEVSQPEGVINPNPTSSNTAVGLLFSHSNTGSGRCQCILKKGLSWISGVDSVLATGTFDCAYYGFYVTHASAVNYCTSVGGNEAGIVRTGSSSDGISHITVDNGFQDSIKKVAFDVANRLADSTTAQTVYAHNNGVVCSIQIFAYPIVCLHIAGRPWE